ncbi:MAG: UvrD-helicase domain-containing protein [Cellulophaga sp.]
MQESPYKIFNASAGSGKTYTLAKEYLKIVLSSDAYRSYSQILAITFTNKAVNEMKQRILGSLFEFGKTETIENASPMFLSIAEELDLSQETLQKRAKKTLKEILHNYAFFDISTIDKFTHRLIRTFAKDLKLPQNFEVVLDVDLLLSEAVDRLLDKAGSDEQLTKIVIDFALEKIDDDKSWDVTLDLNRIGKLLFSENHSIHVEKLQEKSIGDFLELKKNIRKQLVATKKQLIDTAKSVLEFISDNGAAHTDFTRSSFPKFILKVEKGDFKSKLDTAWSVNFETVSLYNKSCSDTIKSTLDEIHPQLIDFFNSIKKGIHQYSFLNNCYTNIVPLTVLNAILHEIKGIEMEKNQLPISSFNLIVANEINNQPAPFIYERLGEKYRHYFVDEFQDTSQMQWKNLIPLIGNALESEDDQGKKGSLLLVGDAKQAIYRWRGGKVEQFMDLINVDANPFVFPPEVKNLPTNFRSDKEIINFNNDFFNATSEFLSSTAYEKLFVEGNMQESNSKEGGFVQISFIDEEEGSNENEVYCDKVLEIINQVIEKGFGYKDICILTRDNKHGILLAGFLTQSYIPTISSDSLLLQSSSKVCFLINFLEYSLQPNNDEICYSLLYFLSEEEENRHDFIYNNRKNLKEFLEKEYNFSYEHLKQLSVYDGLEYIIKQFNIVSSSDAYITYLMDEVLNVEQKEGPSTQTFLQYWEKKKGKLSVTAPEDVNAVQLMSVHKSKGLEFPVVIFPFANSHIYKEVQPKLWLSVDKDNFNQFEEVLINKKQEVVNYGEQAEYLYNEEQRKLELDAFNVLYVALTRPVNALYVVSKKDITRNNEHKTEYYSGLFIHFLKQKGIWNLDEEDFTFGNLEFNITKSTLTKQQQGIPYIYTNKERTSFNILTKAGELWDTDKEQALSKGNLIHELLGSIETEKDVDKVFFKFVSKGHFSEQESILLKNKVMHIITHPKLKEYYSEGNIIRNERDIITERGLILRPDRVIIDGNNATIIDYKTGKKSSRYHEQLNDYAISLKSMGYLVENKIIIYINEEINLEFINN